jgi:cytosine/adenosine deaminase-related metal-dependent hydrolase
MHCAGLEAKTPDGWERLAEDGLLDALTNVVHGNNLTDAQLRLMLDCGVTFSLAPETEMQQGHGHPITGRLRDMNRAPSLGADLESSIAGDMLTVARMALASQRALDNEVQRERTGYLPATSTLTCEDALSWITVRGAEALGLADQIGSLTPGKQADIAMIRADGIRMRPLHDPVAAVVLQASSGDIDSVLVNGEVRKRHGRLTYPHLSQRLDELDASGRRIAGGLSDLLAQH